MTVIANSFRHAGFHTAANIEEVFDEEDDIPLIQWRQYAESVDNLLTECSWDDFVQVDAEVAITEPVTDESIVSNIIEEFDEEDVTEIEGIIHILKFN